MKPFATLRAPTIAAAAASASTTMAEAMTGAGPANGVALLRAGGIDVLDLLKEDLVAPAMLVSVIDIPGLDAIRGDADGLHIGAAATLAAIAAHPLVRERYPALASAVGHSASPQIRNVATLGGNLLQRPRCWYFRSAAYRCLRKGGGHCFALNGENQYHAIFDNHPCAIVHPSTAATVLVALGAFVDLADAHGTSRRVRLENFLVGPAIDLQRENDLQPHEILTAIVLPTPPSGARMAHLRQGERDSMDWPLADVAVLIEMDAVRTCTRAAIILGAAAPVPHRARAAEAALRGRVIDDDAAREAARAALAGATPLAKNVYKLKLFETLIRRAILTAVA